MNWSKLTKRMAAILLTTSLLLPQTQVMAQENTDHSEAQITGSFIYVNPYYQGHMTDEDLVRSSRESFTDDSLAGAADQKVYTSEQAVADRIREYLVQRQEEYTIKVKLPLEKPKGSNAQIKSAIKKLMDKLFDAARQETDKPNEGDYLSYLKGYSAEFEGGWKEKGYFEGTFSYFSPLATTAAQEKEVDASVKKILVQLSLEGKTEYEKIRSIYDYICKNTLYYDSMKDDSGVAYGSLVLHKAVCNGIAMGVYRLMKEAGINCRMVPASSKKPGGEGHAWNIVKIGDLWYHLDATWDLDNGKAGTAYRYFLKKEPFVDHANEFISDRKADFWAAHPVSQTDYPCEDNEEPKDSGLQRPVWPNLEICTKGVRLTWEQDPEVVSCRIFRRTSDGELLQIGESSDGQYLDTKVKSGNVYIYALQAVGETQVSDLSEENHVYFLTPPKNLSIRSVGSKAVQVSWKKMKGITGYQIRYSLKKNFKTKTKTVTINNAKTFKKVIKKLKKKKYYFQIRSIRKTPTDTWVSGWSKTKSFRVS